MRELVVRIKYLQADIHIIYCEERGVSKSVPAKGFVAAIHGEKVGRLPQDRTLPGDCLRKSA